MLEINVAWSMDNDHHNPKTPQTRKRVARRYQSSSRIEQWAAAACI
jgi:hypothetical protein